MASNQARIARRIPRTRRVLVDSIKYVQTKSGLVAQTVKVGKLETFYDYVILQTAGTQSGRVPVAIIEDATYPDAALFLKNPRTERGHSVKGFKKMKAQRD